MASLIRMPGISADAEEAALVEWFVEEGEEIASGSPLAAVETEKATVDIDADEAGVIFKLLAEPGAPVAVGAPIAVLVAVGEATDDEQGILNSVGLGGASTQAGGSSEVKEAREAEEATEPEPALQEAVAAQRSTSQASAVTPPSEPTAPAPAPVAASASHDNRLFASPIVRRLAKEQGIDLSRVAGTGPGGRIVRDDLANVQPSPGVATVADSPPSAPAAPPAAGLVPHSKLRVAVANALAGSKRSAPHFYLTVRCDVGELLALRAQVNESSATRISINDFVIKAVAQGFAEVPEMNVQWHDDGLLTLPSVDISVAIASDKGLVTPVIRNADQARLGDIARGVKNYVDLANSGRLKQSDLEGGSFTVTNLGMFGIEEFSAIINPPQVGILAVGGIIEEVRLDADGTPRGARMMALTLSADHRPVDGALAARWLQSVKRHLESPLSMLV